MATSRSHSRFWRDLPLAAALAIAAAALLITSGETVCHAGAAGTAPSDFCYQTDIALTYTGGGTVTNTPVRVQMNTDGLVDSGRLDPRAWDLKPVIGSFANEVSVTVQDMSETDSGWWVIVPSISNGETRTVRAYTGSGEHRRDQGVYFSGNEYITAADHADFDITDNLTIDVSLNVGDSTARDEIVLEHVDGSGEGYRVEFRDVASALTLTFSVDNVDCDLTWDSAWNDERQDFRFRYVAAAGADAFIDRNGSNAVSCDTDSGALTTSANPLIIGALTGTFANKLSGALIQTVDVLASGSSVARWSFNPEGITEISSSNPFTGTVADVAAGTHPATYTFDRDQTGWAYTVGASQLVSGTSQVTLADSNPDVLGPAFGALDPSAAQVESTSGIFYNSFINKWVSTSPVRSFGYITVMGVFGLLFALLTYRLTKMTVLSLLVFGVPFAVGVGNGWIPAWWMILWIVLVMGGWFAQRQAESS